MRVEVEPIFPEYTEVGGGFSTAAGRFTFHGEDCLPSHPGAIDDDYLQYVPGFDYTLDPGSPRRSTASCSVSSTRARGRQRDTRPGSTFRTGFDRVFVNSVLGMVDFVFSEDT